MTPKRFQRSRKKGAKLPAGVVSVTRPGRWGNPFIVRPDREPGSSFKSYICVPTAEDAVACFRDMVEQKPAFIAEIREKLAGKHLACFCRTDEPCHADVLLEIANKKDQPDVSKRNV